MTYRLTTRGVGNRARLDIVRQGRPLTIEIALRVPPGAGRDDVRNLSGNHPLDGARVANLVPAITESLGLDDQDGVAIVSVRPGSVAGSLGFRAGDIVVQIGAKPIASVRDLDDVLTVRQRVWLIAVKRGERVLQLRVPG